MKSKINGRIVIFYQLNTGKLGDKSIRNSEYIG